MGVSEDGHYLESDSEKPFIWLGDTAWELLHRLTLAESELYLTTRSQQGFTVIQTVILSEKEGLRVPNANGDLPLEGFDPTRPNEAYFQHVDNVIAKANELGLVVGLLPAWGDKFNRRNGNGPEIFTPSNAETYCRYLGNRYGDASIVWILGGDRSPEQPVHFEIIDAMARGLRSSKAADQLITYHPQGRQSSSRYFHDREWLDFNMFQSSHGQRDYHNFRDVKEDLAMRPLKPTLDGEPCYENIPIGFKLENGRFDESDTRKAAYWSILQGACGYTYGHNSVWQMWQPGLKPAVNAEVSWKTAIISVGSQQIQHMRRLLERSDWHGYRPRPDLLLSKSELQASSILAAESESVLLVYSPWSESFSLKVEEEANYRFGEATWFDPRDGMIRSATPVERSVQSVRYDPPGETGRGNDWILIVDRNQVSSP